jgi:hypothetical protein
MQASNTLNKMPANQKEKASFQTLTTDSSTSILSIFYDNIEP